MTISLSETVKKIGRPVGSKNKTNKIELVKVVKKPKVAAANKDRLNDLNYSHELLARIKNLEHQAIGYRAVISYLSHQLELKP
jgi:tetrahydromethanopterin S-methyltransferase subunit F